MNQENILEKLDSFLLTKKQNERIIIYLSIFLILFVLSFQYLFPITKKMVQKSKTKKQEIENNIKEDKDYIASITINGDKEFLIKKLNKEIEQLKTKFTKIKDNNDYLDLKIKSIKNLIYNEKNWAKFLDSIAKKGIDNGVDIKFISNKFINNSKNFGHVLEIEIECNGDFKNTIGFINSIEESDLVVDIYGVKMKSDFNIQTYLKVSVWGIKY